MKVENRAAQHIAAQMEWLANKVGNHGSVKRFSVSWDGESEHLQGEITMDAPAWIRSVLAEQNQVQAQLEHAHAHGVQEGMAQAGGVKSSEGSSSGAN